MLRAILDFFTLRNNSDALLAAQSRILSRNIPILYAVLCINAWALCFTTFSSAPLWRTFYLPALLSLFCLYRAIMWLRVRNEPFERKSTIRRLNSTTFVGVILGILFLKWALAMNQFDVITDIDRISIHGHVTFFVGITVVSCCLLLMYHAPAAISISVVILLPFAIYLMQKGHRVEASIAVNLLLVVGAMFYVLLAGANGLQRRVASEEETQTLSRENAHIAHMDSLTQLPNRRSFFDELAAMLATPAAQGRIHAVGIMDLDGFKQANDLYGHVMGDKVLMTCAERLRLVGSGKVFVSRLGGDEFGLIIRDQPTRNSIVMIGDELCDAISLPFNDAEQHISLGASIGFCIVDDSAQSAQHIYEAADYALHHAKNHNRGAVVIFSDEHQSTIRKKVAIEQELRHADLESELSLNFQPIVDATTGDIAAFEALARWHNAILGFVSPGDFIPVAERSDIVLRMTRILLGKALEAVKAWPQHVQVSFNLSTRDLMSSWQISQIVKMVENSGVDARRIIFEVTESAMVDEFEKAKAALVRLKALGSSIALDDFGTGYSSLAYIHRLPLNKIKIDRSFVTNIEESEASRNIVRSVVRLCETLGLKSVVEGMETQPQAEVLLKLGCHLMQGYYFARPLPFDEACRIAAEGMRKVA